MSLVAGNNNLMFNSWLKAAYQYYWGDNSPLSDGIWDQMGKHLKAEWETIKHPLKDHVEYDNMGSLHYIPKKVFEDYFGPLDVQ